MIFFQTKSHFHKVKDNLQIPSLKLSESRQIIFFLLPEITKKSHSFLNILEEITVN